MKNKIYLPIGLLLLGICISCSKESPNNHSQENALSLYSTPELYDLTKEWAGVYCKINPDVEINIVNITESSVPEILDNTRNVSFVSGNLDSVIYANSLWKVVVGRDVIVPVMNSENPDLDEIYRQGISPEGFIQIIEYPGITNWGNLLKTGHKTPVNLYVTDDATLNSGLAKFLNKDQVIFNGKNIVDTKDLIAAVQADRYSVGICKITDVIDPNTHRILENVKLLPIDINGNGRIDYKENVYDNLQAFSRGVWIGKYPRALSNNIYSVSATQPTNSNEIAFLKWIITSGQALLDNYGFRDLEQHERLAQVKWIDGYNVDNPGVGNTTNPKEPLFNSPIPFILAIILLAAILGISWFRFLNKRVAGVPAHMPIPKLILNEDSVDSSPGLYYDKTHTWAFLDNDGLVKVGIDDFLQHITGPLSRVKMKMPGERIRKGKQAVSIIQDGKQLDICAPVSGIIKEQNKILSTNTSIINSSPYTDGWIYKIEPTNWLKEVQFLIMEKTYKEWLKAEIQRLKEFLTDALRPGNFEYAHVLQDGGEITDRILEDLGPEAWEDFQTNFIDVSS